MHYLGKLFSIFIFLTSSVISLNVFAIGEELVEMEFAPALESVNGIEDPKSVGWYAYRDLSSSGFSSKFQELKGKGYRLVDVEEYNKKYSGIWVKNTDNRQWAAWRNLSDSAYKAKFNQLKNSGYRLIDIEAYRQNGKNLYAGVWVKNKENLQWASWRNLTTNGFNQKFQQYKNQGYMLIDVEAYKQGSNNKYAGIWVKNKDNLKWAAWRNLTSSQFSVKFKQYSNAGYRMIDIESYRQGTKQLYAGIWVKNTNGRSWKEYRDQTASGYKKKWTELNAKGYRLIDIEVYSTSKGKRYASIWRQNTNATVTKAMFNVIKNFDGELAFYAININNNKKAYFQANKKQYLASVTKVAVMAEAYRQQVQEGRNLSATRRFSTGFYREEGKRLKFAQVNNSYTLDKYIEYMIDNSDTTSTDMMVSVLGESKINNMLNSLNLTGWGKVTSIVKLDKNIWSRRDSKFNSEQNHVFEDWLRNSSGNRNFNLSFSPSYSITRDKAYNDYYKTGWNSGTPKHLVKLVERMAKGTLWSSTASQAMMNKLALNSNPLFRQKLPSSVKAGSKNGGKYQVKTEVGYLTDSAGNPEVVLAILSRKVPNTSAPEVLESFKELGKRLYNKVQ